jgi:multidrug efflux system membrane fusion protein
MSRWIVRLAIAVAGIVLVVVLLRARTHGGSPAQTKNPEATRAVPVLTAAVEQRDVPVWLEGLGTVTAWQQVTVRSQVDGRLLKVFFQEGQMVKQGQLLAQIDPRPFQVQLHQAEGALARDRAQLQAGKLDLERYKELTERKLIAPQQVDQQKGAVGQAEGAVEVDLAAVESAKLNLDYCQIRAPFDGVVGVRLVDPGNLVHATDTGGIVVLTQLDPAAVLFTLPEDNLPQIADAQKRGDVPVEAWSRDGQQLLGKGGLAALDNQINQATATLRLKARLPNPDRKLWPNEFVKARALVDTAQGAHVVPAAAVQRGPDGSFVYVVGADDTVQPRPVKVGLTTGDIALVQSGVAPGETVVVEGQNQLRPGSKVQVQARKTGGKQPSVPPRDASAGTE